MRYLLPGLLLLAGVDVYAQATRMIPPVVSSAARTEQVEASTPLSMTVITRQDIEDSGAVNLSGVLRGQGVVHLIDTFGNGVRSTVGMRGFGESANANTLVLVDGRRLNNSDIAGPDLNSVSLKDVARIEIINGSASVLFGDQAVGGVINIITRKPDTPSLSMEAVTGSYNSHQMVASYSQRFKNGFYLRFSGEKETGDGYRDHNNLDYENLFALFGHDYGAGEVFVELQGVDEELQTPGALYVSEARVNRQASRPEYRNDFVDTLTQVFRGGIRHRLNEQWLFEGELTWRDSDGEFLQSFRNAPEFVPATQKRRVASFNPRLIGRYEVNNDRMLLTIGYDRDVSRYRLHSRFGPQNNDQQVSGWYGQVIYPFSPKLKFGYGVRYTEVKNNLQDGGLFALYPDGIRLDDELTVNELGLEYRPSSHWRWFVRVAETFRFAKVDEYLSPFGGAVLDNQSGTSWETGVSFQGSRHDISLTAYRLILDNELAFDPNSFSNLNLDETRRDGFSLSGSYRMNPRWQISGNYQYVDAGVTRGVFGGNRVPLVAEHGLRATLEYRPGNRWLLTGELHAVSDRPYSGDFTNVLDELPGHGVINFKARYQHRQWTAGFGINNLLDKEYAEFGARNDEFPPPLFLPVANESIQPSPERNFRLYVRYTFE